MVDVKPESGQLNVVVGGVAGNPSEAQSEVVSALTRAGLPNTNTDFSAIAPIEPGGCSALNAYRQIRYIGSPRLSTAQLVWDMHLLKSGDYAGEQGAQPIITLDVPDPKVDLTLLGIAPSGIIDQPLPSRAFLDRTVAQMAALKADNLVKLPNGSYQVKMDIDHQGWSGLVLITGKGPFPADIVKPPLGARNIAWQDRFATYAAQHGWKADMLWFKVENQRTGD